MISRNHQRKCLTGHGAGTENRSAVFPSPHSGARDRTQRVERSCIHTASRCGFHSQLWQVPLTMSLISPLKTSIRRGKDHPVPPSSKGLQASEMHEALESHPFM